MATQQECPILYSLTIDSESIDVSTLLQLPRQTRVLRIVNCPITTPMLDMIAQRCPHLLELYLESSIHEDCSLESLLTMTRLNRLNISETNLTADQEQIVAHLRSTLSQCDVGK